MTYVQDSIVIITLTFVQVGQDRRQWLAANCAQYCFKDVIDLL